MVVSTLKISTKINKESRSFPVKQKSTVLISPEGSERFFFLNEGNCSTDDSKEREKETVHFLFKQYFLNDGI